MMLEALVYAGLLAVVAARPDVRDLARQLPRGYRAASASLVLLMVTGQLAAEERAMFPFVVWDMYTHRAPGDAVVFAYTGVTRAGDERVVDLVSVAGAVGQRWPLASSVARYLRAKDAAQRVAQADACRARLHAIAELYNERNAQEPIDTLRVWRARIPISRYRGPDSITRDLLWEISLSPASGAEVGG